jgi:D-lactate dehydrogenase
VCPSRELTTTPRQRIALRREMHRQGAGSPVAEALLAGYGAEAVDSCAGESLCAAACPVGIDTGALMRDFRRARRGRAEERAATALARHWGTAGRAARTTLAAAAAVRARTRPADVLPDPTRTPQRGAAGPFGFLSDPPGAAPRLPHTAQRGAAAVYYPACANRLLGPARGRRGWVVQALVALAERAGSPLWIPPGVAGTCCAAPWRARGHEEGAALMANRAVEHAWGWTGGGRLPVVVDAQSCALGLGQGLVPLLTGANRELHEELTIVDAVSWTAEQLLPKLTVASPAGSAVLHPTCAGHRLAGPDAAAGDDPLAVLARALASEVAVPEDAGCCGCGSLTAGVTAAATRPEAEEVAARPYELYLSADRLCEAALERATGEPYESVLVALERATRP